MNRIVTIGLLLLLALPVAAQTPKPDWCDAATRQARFPETDYFVGYQSTHVQQGETADQAVARCRAAAQSDAAQRLQVRVESTALDAVQSAQRQTTEGQDEEIVRLFRRQTVTSTDVELPNLQAVEWAGDGEVAVMVYTSRHDLARYYDRQIESLLGHMETAYGNVQQLEQQGAQIKARGVAEEALRLCPQVEEAQRMEALADVHATLADLQMQRYAKIAGQLTDAVARLRHATAFFIACKALIDGKPYPLLDKEVRTLLAEQGCQFTDDRAAADWVIDIDADVINVEQQSGMACFAYVDGSLAVHHGRTGRQLLDDRLSALEPGHYDGIKGGDFKPERAARMAYHDAARIIAAAVMKLIQE